MKSLVKFNKGPGFVELRELPIPEPGFGEALIRVRACGICGTDIKILDDGFVYYPPVVIGHEFSGTVESLGEGTAGVAVGDRVVSEQHTKACGACGFCLTGKRHLCAEKRSPGYGVDGAFAEYMKVPASLLHRIPGTVSFEEATLVEPMGIAACGVLGKTRIEPEDFVVILGCGPIALLTLQMVRAEGARDVVMTGLAPDMAARFAMAEELGASRLINTQEVDPIPAVMEMTRGIGADVVVDLTGSPKAILQGLDMLRKDGRFCALGLTHEAIPLPWMKLTLKAVNIIFSYSSDYTSWKRCLSMIEKGKVVLSPFTRDIYPLSQWEDAFEKARTGESLKVIIRP